MPIRTFFIALLAFVAIAGCGRRGNLDTPGEVQADETPFEQTILDAAASPGASEPPETRPVDGPDRPFFLDPLI